MSLQKTATPRMIMKKWKLPRFALKVKINELHPGDQHSQGYAGHPTTTSQTPTLVVAKGADQRMMAEGGPIRRRRRRLV
jgi:hypothetical protein